MLRATLVIAALLIFSSAPLDAKHKRDRNRGNFFVQFSIGGGGHHYQPQRFRGRGYYDDRHFRNRYRGGGYYRSGYHGDGYYDSRRRHHKHKRFKHNRYNSRHYRDHYRCFYH